jgi:tetratricopeptide (TPR) repeat protein
MNRIWILLVCVSVLVLSGPVYGEEIPFSEPIDIKVYEDHYDLQKSVTIYIKENSTYTTETRIVTVSIAPQDYCYYQGEPLKEFFCDIMVSIAISTADEETTKEFLSYLNFDAEEQTLFWDNAEYGNADHAGDSFGEDDSLTIKDEHIEVTLALMQFMPSEYLCGSCETDAAGYISFIDTIRFLVTIGYTQAQKDVIEDMQDDAERGQDAQEYIITAQQYFQQQEYQKAQQEYQNAKDIFDEIGDTENSEDMLEWINKCAAYDKAAENFKDGTDLFEEAATTSDYKEAINLYEDAKSYFQRAKTEFDRAEDTTQSDQCDTWINRCDDEIDNLKDVGVLRGRLIYILVGIAVIGAIAVVVKQLSTEKAPKQKGKPMGITLRARNTETNQEVSLDVQPTDKMGKVQQTAATKLGLIPSGVFHKGRPCPPDQTVAECGLANGSVVDIVPRSESKPRESPAQTNNQEKLARLEQQYREGKITKELYENLKRKLEK